MPAIVSAVEIGSIAEELEIENGDILLSIDGQKLIDLIDYRFYCKTEELTIEIRDGGGGPFFNIKTDSWSIDDPNQLAELINDFKSRLNL